MRCVITTRSNLFGFKQNGQGGDTLPIFLPNVMLAHLIQPVSGMPAIRETGPGKNLQAITVSTHSLCTHRLD
ncbi:hypothetical protein ACUN90_12950, partial [Escherichia sp. SP-MK2]